MVLVTCFVANTTALGNRKSFKLTNNGALQYTLTYDYDKMNRLTKVYENGTAKATYEYNDDGTLKKSSYGAQTTDYTYNLANLLTEVHNTNEPYCGVQ